MTIPIFTQSTNLGFQEVFDVHFMHQYFATGITRPYSFRKAQLQKLLSVIQQNEQAIANALHADLKKPLAEIITTEIGLVYHEIGYALKHLDSWMEPEYVENPLPLKGSQSAIFRDPLGVVLVIAAWNYPFQLTMMPLIGAIAGGNCVVVKPSETAPETAQIIDKILSDNFSSSYLQVINGDGAFVVENLLKNNHFNHLFYTGSTAVGKKIAKLAAENLTPVTLELGGKSPCIVYEDADIELAARRIVWGKFSNAGQTCIAPDYVLVQVAVREQLITALKNAIIQMYGSDASQSADYGRIINQQHYQRLCNLLNQSTVLFGGDVQQNENYIAPTLIDATPYDEVMKDEIFGPLLPIIPFETTADAVAIVDMHANPLALYLFTQNVRTQHQYIHRVSFGGGCINDTLLHSAHSQLPFGGVGNSGVGQYHGKFSFSLFTRPKAVLKASTRYDVRFRYPPFANSLKWLKRFFNIQQL